MKSQKPKLRYPLDQMVRNCKNGPHKTAKQYQRKPKYGYDA